MNVRHDLEHCGNGAHCFEPAVSIAVVQTLHQLRPTSDAAAAAVAAAAVVIVVTFSGNGAAVSSAAVVHAAMCVHPLWLFSKICRSAPTLKGACLQGRDSAPQARR